MHKKKMINPEELTEAEKERCFVPRWTVGAVDALHEALEDYLMTLLEDANLLAIHAKCHFAAKRYPAGSKDPGR